MIILIVGGMMVGFCFDVYRIMRWRLGLNRVLTFIGDLVFSVVALFIVFFFAQKANYLEFRFYLFGASLLGLLLYLRIFSPVIKKICNFIIDVLVGIKKLILSSIAKIFRSGTYVLTTSMRIPYGILRWFALLFFRICQALGREGRKNIKVRVDKNPKEK